MAKIYKVSDKIPVKIDGLQFFISPLNFEQKAEIQALILEGQPVSIMRAARQAIKYSVKDVKGIENMDGSQYDIDRDENGLTDDCVDDLLNLDQDDKLSMVCTSLLNGIPKDFIDPQTGEKIKGISIQRGPSPKKK